MEETKKEQTKEEQVMPIPVFDKPKILVCEDLSAPRKIILRLLKKEMEGFEIVVATNPKEAEEAIETQGDFVIILMDNLLGEGLTGTQILRKHQKKVKNSFCYSLSSIKDTETLDPSVYAGYIGKPLELNILKEVLNEAKLCSPLLKGRELLSQSSITK